MHMFRILLEGHHVIYTPNMVYKGHRQITTILSLKIIVLKCAKTPRQKTTISLLAVSYKGVPYKPYWVYRNTRLQ